MASSQDTICTLCFETLKNPFILKCQHNLCEECVKRAETLHKAFVTLEPPNKKKQEPASDKPSLACPLCGVISTVEECRPNITLRNVLGLQKNAAVLDLPGDDSAEDSTDSGKKSVCGFCKEPATVFCAFCGPLCQEHSDFLHVKGPLRSHALSKTPIEVVKSIKEVVGNKDDADDAGSVVLPLCKDHGKQMELFCAKCECLVCPHCILIGEHQGHECIGVLQAFKKTNERIEDLLKKIKEKAPECENLVKGYDRLCSGADKEHDEVKKTVIDSFAEFRKIVDDCEKKALEEVEEIFTSFKSTVSSRTTSLHALRDECNLVQKSADTTAAKNELIRYTLFKSLKCLSEHLSVVASAQVPEDATICSATVNKALLDASKFSLVKLRPMFRMGMGRVIYYNINWDTLPDTRNERSEITAGNNTSHDGGAIYDASRRIILSVSGNYNNGRNLKITRMTDGTHGETTLMTDVIPYGTHGQYPVFDGRQFTYFFQSEDGDNNRFGRVDMDTLTFSPLPNLPTSQFREFCSGCVQNDHVYALDRDLNIRDFNIASNEWGTLRVTMPRPGRLMTDPCESNIIYCLCCDGRGLFRIDVVAGESTHVCDTPSNFSLGANGEAFLARISPSEFFIFAGLSGGWHVYSRERNTWVQLRNWRNVRNGSGHFIIVPDGPTGFYHVDDADSWEMVNLGA